MRPSGIVRATAAIQVDQACLRGSVGCGPRRRADRADARDIDDRSPAWLVLHDAVRYLREVQRGQKVQANDRFGKTRRRGRRFRTGGTPGIVDQNVDSAMMRYDCLDAAFDLFVVPHIGRPEGRAPAGRGRELFRFGAPDDGDMRSGLQEASGYARPNPSGASRYDHYPIAHVERVWFSSIRIHFTCVAACG